MRGCTFSETNDKREVLNTIDELVSALPKASKRSAAVLASSVLAIASSSRLQQMPIEQSLQAASKLSVDQALADWVYEAGMPFNVFR